jgi:hypothetical protein
MRPVPSSKHILSVMLFLAFAVGSGFMAWRDDRLSEDQIAFATAAAQRHQPDLLRYDTAYGKVHADGRLGRLHTPVFLGLMELSLIPTDYRDLSLPFRVGVAPFVFLYLCGMYVLLWRQTRSSTIAAFVSILSATILSTFGEWFWGIGPLASITPQGIVIAVAPLILLSYLQNSDRMQVVIAFGAAGLCVNLHPIAAANLAIILLIVHVGRNRFRLRSLGQALGGVVLFLVGAAPYVLYFLALRRSIAQDSGGAAADPAAVLQALRISNLAVLYPEMLKSLLRWALYVAALAAPTGVLLWRLERFHTRDISVWLWMAGAALLVSLGFHGLSQFVGWTLGSNPPIIDFIQASSWVMLPIYVLFAQALTHLFRIVRRNRRYVQYACAAFLVAWMLPSDNLRYVRHTLYDVSTRFLNEADRPMRVQELKERRVEKTELAALADWARENTDPDTMFLTDQSYFRMRARRNLFACREDVRMFYYLAPWMLRDWTDQLLRQYAWLRQPMDTPRLRADVNTIAAEPPYRGVRAWYVLAPTSPGEANFKPLKEIVSPSWGQYWRLFEIPVRGLSPADR